MSAERRRHPRVSVDVPIRLTAVDDGATIDGRVRDVSVDAILVEAETSWVLGVNVLMELQLPETRAQLRLTGTVIRLAEGESGGRAMAILFTDLPPAAATSIDLFLATQ